MTEEKAEPLQPELPVIRQVSVHETIGWLEAAWSDLKKRLGISLAYGLLYAGISVAILVFMLANEMERAIIPGLSGFMIMGPVLAIGLYHVSRCIECGRPCQVKTALAIRSKAPGQLMFIAAILLLALLAWLRIGVTIYAFFFGLEGIQGDQSVFDALLFTSNGLVMLLIGSVVGAFLFFLLFSISVFSIPLLMLHDCDALTAIIFSISAVLKNTRVMFVWAMVLSALVAAGFMTGFVGFMLTYPLTAFASWHAFRGVIGMPRDKECNAELEAMENKEASAS